MNLLIKRCIDVSLSLIAIIIMFPILLIISVAVRFDSKGPALFRQGRLTKNGKVFTMYKFRTMIENAEQMGTGLFNYANDFRVTRVGKFLRKSSLDELPQLFNIIKGDMSIVGPRPPVTYELGDYEELSDDVTATKNCPKLNGILCPRTDEFCVKTYARALPWTWGLSPDFPERVIKRAILRILILSYHSLRKTSYAARVAPQRCSILHMSKSSNLT